MVYLLTLKQDKDGQFNIPDIVWGPGYQEDAEDWALLNGWLPAGGEFWYRSDISELPPLRLQHRG